MKKLDKSKHPYNVCAIDIGSPKRKSIGWCLIDNEKKEKEIIGENLNDLFPLIADATKNNGLILGLEAPLFVPVRKNELRLTSARMGDGNKPWSAGAGAQVLAINLPIMVYIFDGIIKQNSNITFFLNEEGFEAKSNQIMIFEAFVSGKDKKDGHIGDATIMARSCADYSNHYEFPPTILEDDQGTEYFNLAAAALLRCGINADIKTLSLKTPIYKPTPVIFNQ